MSYKKIFWGIILIVIGIMVMLKNLDLIWFSWQSLWALWPVFFILWGISVLPVKDYLKLIISLAAVAGGIAVVSTQSNINTFGFHWHRQNKDWQLKYDTDENFKSDENYSEPFEKSIKEGTLYLDAAAGRFIVKDSTHNLYDFEKAGGDMHYQTSVEKDSTSAVIRLKLKDGNLNVGKDVESRIKLNKNPMWDINFHVGAADMQMDLSNYKVRSLELEGGASSIYLKTGDLDEDQKIKISAGASSIHILVPKSRACEIKTNTILSSRDLPGFNRTERHVYRSDNFNNAKIKTYINVDAAVSSLNVERY